MSVQCRLCGQHFKTPQGLAGHMRFRHGDAEWSAAVDRAQEQRLELLESFADMPTLPSSVALLVAKLRQKYGDRRTVPGETRCVICDIVCKTPQGLAAHMRFRHGSGTSRSGSGRSGELLRILSRYSLPEPVTEAVWEKVLRLEGFRW
ncbi:MAG: hypothetical protein HQ548_02765 [Chloroflexi bacterium]|nr:hypothetical protein [Chloroflexota bacterium]